MDLVFSDFILPDGTGLELFRSLPDPRPRFILASGYTDEKVDMAALKKEDVLFIQKPFVIKELLERVKAVMEGGGGRDSP